MKISMIILFALIVCAFKCVSANESQPNWWIILADDISKEYIYGSKNTPNLDIMAKEGVKFTRAWEAPVCSVTRANLISGSLARYHGVTRNGNLANGLQEPLPKIPGQSGLFGKWNVPGYDHTQIFDYWFMWSSESRRSDLHGFEDRFTASRFYSPAIDNNGEILDLRGQYGPHVIASDALRWANDIVDSGNDESFLVWHMMVEGHAMRNGRYPTPPGFKHNKDNLVRYRQNIADIDMTVGQVMAFARNNNTIVVFATDNPTATEGKNSASPEGCSIPMIIWGPEWIIPRSPVKSSVQLRDLYSTIYESRNMTPPTGAALNSISMWGALNRGESFLRDFNRTDYRKVTIVQKGNLSGVAPTKRANLKNLEIKKGSKELESKKPSKRNAASKKQVQRLKKKFKKERRLKLILIRLIEKP